MTEFGIINTNEWQETFVTPRLKSFVNVDKPQVMHIIESGWQEPPMYSVIIEDGELGYPNLEFFSKETIQNKFNIKL